MLVLSEGDDDKEKGKVAPKALLFLLLLKPSQGFTKGGGSCQTGKSLRTRGIHRKGSLDIASEGLSSWQFGDFVGG